MKALDQKQYYAVIHSARWRALRLRLIRARGARCARCGKTWAPGFRPQLSLHHTTYERLGRERDDDLLLLCDACHEPADQERAIRSGRRAQQALYAARLDGWASARYGDDWAACGDAESIEAEFVAWLDE